MIGLFPLRLVKGILFVCHEQGFSWPFRSYNSGKMVISSKYNIQFFLKFVMMNDHKWLVGCM